MGTKVLLSQAGCPQHRFGRESPAPTISPKSSHLNCGRRMRSPIANQANQHDRYHSRLCDQSPGPNLVMGQVKILKRGEKLSFDSGCSALAASGENHNAGAKSEEDLDLVIESTDRLGRDPKMAQNHSKVGVFAGFAFDGSPSPGSVPIPRFLGKKLRW
ncbi:uncharacterized protein LOC129320798 [Prosopis cineraria]|uniref:uncharacterized protein LOC129320798 n=1 Tax=Prosopis cineraria TaxID=364024 RepID=UPI0024109453|nr:uncharacterized protein LOC129320798 [Prosopis cineraria]